MIGCEYGKRSFALPRQPRFLSGAPTPIGSPPGDVGSTAHAGAARCCTGTTSAVRRRTPRTRMGTHDLQHVCELCTSELDGGVTVKQTDQIMEHTNAPASRATPLRSGDIFALDKHISGKTWGGRSLNGRLWAIYQGSAIEVMKKMPSESVDCIITSPPYFWLRDYGVRGQIGLEETVDEYVDALSEVISECRRVLKSTGLLFLNIGDTFYSGKGESHGRDAKSKKRRFGLRAVDRSGGLGIGLQRKSLIGIPWRVILRLMSNGWALRSSVIWHRKNRLPEPVKDRPGRSYEYVFILAKSRRYYFKKDQLDSLEIEEDLWTIATQPYPTNGLNTAPFPDELVERCLSIGCPISGVVLDPFMGSGTTIRVALSKDRSSVGIDLNEKFCRYAAHSIEDAK